MKEEKKERLKEDEMLEKMAEIKEEESGSMDESNIEKGRHKFCGGKVIAYKQNRPFANYLIGCIYCGDYFNADNLPKGVFIKEV